MKIGIFATVPTKKEGMWDCGEDPRLNNFLVAYGEKIGSIVTSSWDKKDAPLTTIMFLLDLPKGSKDESIPMLTEPLRQILQAEIEIVDED